MLHNLGGGSLLRPFFMFEADGGGSTGGNSGSSDGNGATDDKKKEVRMPQERLDQLMSERADRARESVTKELLGIFGVQSVDDLKTLAKGVKDDAEAKKTAEQKTLEKIQALETEVATSRTAATQYQQRWEDSVRQNALTAEATAQGFLPESLNDVWLLVRGDTAQMATLKIDDQGKIPADAVKKIVTTIAENKKHWLVRQSSGGGTPRTGSGRQTNLNTSDQGRPVQPLTSI